MSIANILTANRCSSVNVHANSLVLAPLSNAEQDAITTPQEGQVILNSEIPSIGVYTGGSWKYLLITPTYETVLATWLCVANVPVPGLTQPFVGNSVTTISSGGLNPDANGVLDITRKGLYRVSCTARFNTAVPMLGGSVYAYMANRDYSVTYVLTEDSAVKGSTAWSMNFDYVLDLNVGDSLTMWVNSAALPTTLQVVGGSSLPVATNMQVQYLGS